MKGVLFEKMSKNSLVESLVGNGIMVIRGDGVDVGVTVTCGVGIVVGMDGKNLFGTGVGGDQSERWFEISSLALMARTGVHTMERMTMHTINGKNFIGIPRVNKELNKI